MRFIPRHHHRADNDHAEHRGQEFVAPGVILDGHGSVRHRLLPVRLRRHDRVRHAQLLLLHRAEAPGQDADAENGKAALESASAFV